jgi:hypothetical protein
MVASVPPPEDKGIIDVVENLNYDQIKFTANEDLIHYIDTAVDEAFIKSTIEKSFGTG